MSKSYYEKFKSKSYYEKFKSKSYYEKFKFNHKKLNINTIRNDFPILSKKINNNNLIWFDNGATTQKPLIMINKIKSYYSNFNANVHRSPHYLSKISSLMFDNVREITKKYINANSSDEIIFTRGTTEGINLLANTIGKQKLSNGGTILLSNMEHHANIVPWQLAKEMYKFELDYIFFNKETGNIDLVELENKLITNKTIKIVSITHVSNILGVINPIKKIAEIVHKYNAILIIDGAQGIPHIKINVKDIDCDFYVFSSHKLFGPTSVGIVYGKKYLLDDMQPYQGGGSMIKNVTLYSSTFQNAPLKFEAGTPSIAEIIGFGQTLEYLNQYNWDDIYDYEHKLMVYLFNKLIKINKLVLLSNEIINRVPVFSFVLNISDPQKFLEYLDSNGIAIRYGHHCSQPTLSHLGYENVFRVSLAFYNTFDEIDIFIQKMIYYISKL